MSQQRLTLTLAAVDVPRAEALLTLAGAETIALSDAADEPVIEPAPNTTPLWPSVTLHALFASDADLVPLVTLLAATFPAAAVGADILAEATWRRGLEQAVQARPVGARLWLAPADDERAPGDRVVLRLHMGLAFGTGAHPTTALCLEWLEGHVTRGNAVLDYGCGSGILALAALVLGAARAYAVDNDEQALTATRANATLNGVGDRLVVAAPAALPALQVDVLAANILARPLVDLAPRLVQLVKPAGWLVLSGILAAQAPEVAAAYAPYCGDVEHSERGGWVRLAARRKPS